MRGGEAETMVFLWHRVDWARHYDSDDTICPPFWPPPPPAGRLCTSRVRVPPAMSSSPASWKRDRGSGLAGYCLPGGSFSYAFIRISIKSPVLERWPDHNQHLLPLSLGSGATPGFPRGGDWGRHRAPTATSLPCAHATTSSGARRGGADRACVVGLIDCGRHLFVFSCCARRSGKA